MTCSNWANDVQSIVFASLRHLLRMSVGKFLTILISQERKVNRPLQVRIYVLQHDMICSSALLGSEQLSLTDTRI